MDPDDIKRWLEEEKKDRHWLAAQCHVSKPTVDGWLSAGRKIPAPALAVIRGLMTPSAPISPKVALPVFMKAQRKAEAEGITLDEWMAKVIEAAVNEPDQLPKSGKPEKKGG
jgi:hypothetical protein